MRILAIDYGTRRMSMAICDELGMIAQPLEFILAEPLAELPNAHEFSGALRELRE